MGENSPFYFSLYSAVLRNVTTLLPSTYSVRIHSLILYTSCPFKEVTFLPKLFYPTRYRTLHKHELQEHIWLPRDNVKGMYNG